MAPALFLIVDAATCGSRFTRALSAALTAIEEENVWVSARMPNVPAPTRQPLEGSLPRRGHPRLVLHGDAARASAAGFASVWLRDGDRTTMGHGHTFASTHDPSALSWARRAGATALLAPVLAPTSKPGAGLGWATAGRWVRAAGGEAFALGGMGPSCWGPARDEGFAGIVVNGFVCLSADPLAAIDSLLRARG